ncbi:Histidine biosynthesis bifunctional protein hisB [Tulasnella sp. UAMH 9824]|nr:Histidine biosynthesis bifunctional protein hisB [Tulasnella sp. UAMH 9824]
MADSQTSSGGLYVLDYGAGNVRSIANTLTKLGYSFKWISQPEDFAKAEKLIFPGVGAFSTAVSTLRSQGLFKPLQDYIASGRPYFGICIGMQILFKDSLEARDLLASAIGGTENEGALTDETNWAGLGLIDWEIGKFVSKDKSVPHMGWNGVTFVGDNAEPGQRDGLSETESYYFVHSYCAPYADDPRISSWANSVTQYGEEVFVSTIKKGNVFATQFHPEKSGQAGLEVLRAWLESVTNAASGHDVPQSPARSLSALKQNVDGFRKRVIACLDVRSNDQGDLVVTKGDQYDVREKDEGSGRQVRNLGKPVALTARYYDAGADEICLLNITSFRNSPLRDQPMLEVVRKAANEVYVPLTIGGGIKDTVDPDGTKRSALEVASEYFRAGADKVSIGSEAVIAVEKMMERVGSGGQWTGDGTSAIEQISRAYGRQAVVVSIDPKRVYISPETSPEDTERYSKETVVATSSPYTLETEKGRSWWYQCTINGGRVLKSLSVVELARGVEVLGAGEILVNSIDRDGTGLGFDLDLIRLIKTAVSIPVVASSGAGNEDHFADVFQKTQVEAALAAGIFHRGEVEISSVKSRCREHGLKMR